MILPPPVRLVARWLAGIALFSSGLPALAGPKPAPLPPLPEKMELGLCATFTSLERPDSTDARPARLVALTVPTGDPVTPFLPPGRFTARWEGSILAELRAATPFTVEGRGKLKLTINGT